MRRIALALFFVPAVALAAPPALLNFTGTLGDDNGPVADGTYSVTVRFFGSATGGTLLWTDTQDVQTSDGVFHYMLGSGTALDETILNQAELWMELEVELDLLSPRLRTVSVPYALQAAAALTADSVNCVGCIAGQEIDSAEVQARVTGTCAAGTAVTGIAATGDVSCAPTMQLAGSGVSPTAAHADHDHDGLYLLQGATLACTGTDKVAGIEAATGNVVCAPDVDTDTTYIGGAGISIVGNTVDVAFAGTSCPGTEKMIGFDVLGVPTCAPDVDTDTQSLGTQVPRSNLVLTADNTGSMGRNTSITIGADGLPVISFREGGTALDLRVFKCTTASCSAGASIAPDGPNAIEDYTSIAIGADGIPVVSYYDLTNTSLKVVRCTDASCSAAATPQVVDGGGAADTGPYNAIAIGVDGLPIIAYQDNTALTLKVAHCTAPDCSVATSTTVDSPNVGQHASIAIGVDGLPVISYRDTGNDDLLVAKCQDVACSLAATVTTVDGAAPVESVGKYTAITVPPDGLPVIAYARENVGPEYDLKVAKCADVGCVAAATITAVDGLSADMGQFASITIGSDGLPIIAYHNATSGTLRVAHCGNGACSAGNSLATVDDGDGGTTIVGEDTSITIGTDGLPIISYRDVNNSALKVTQCANPLCLPNWSRR